MLNPETPPEFSTLRWFNTPAPLTLASLKGKVAVVSAFQLHCPGSLKHGLPQAARMAQTFNSDEVVVIGLNTAFEEHDKQAVGALDAFIKDNGFAFPIAKDKPNGAQLPKTMDAYEIQGTPTILVFDRQGRLRRHYLGQVDDIRLAAEVMALVIESRDAPREQSAALERRLAAALVDPEAHEHEGGCCGGHHDHGHGHEHHAHSHDGGCCGGAHDHEHSHAHEMPPLPAKTAKPSRKSR
ncbi:MAG: redoxin domain-containing protein [Hyphomicrobium sp.]